MPYNDNNMNYNRYKHRYVLTEAHVLEALNVDLRTVLNTSDSADIANAPERLLDRVSKIVYEYIYSICAFRYKTERDLALDDKNRDFICEAMGEQLLYMLNNGDLYGMSGINADTGAVVDARSIRAAQIAPLAKDILINTGIVRAYVPMREREIEPKYTEEGY